MDTVFQLHCIALKDGDYHDNTSVWVKKSNLTFFAAWTLELNSC